jgi:regulator of CtrA degradation
MSEPASINPQIIEGLYCEALILSDEVRDAFALSGRIDEIGQEEDLARVALSCEGLRTTTRMMHAIAWLLNHRAYFMGELSEFQLRRHGRLSPDLRGSDRDNLAMLSDRVRELIAVTDRFYDRLLRLDREWRERQLYTPNAIERLRERLSQRAGL